MGCELGDLPRFSFQASCIARSAEGRDIQRVVCSCTHIVSTKQQRAGSRCAHVQRPDRLGRQLSELEQHVDQVVLPLAVVRDVLY